MAMSKFPINMVGDGFRHQEGTNPFIKPEYVEWIKGPPTSDVSFHIDQALGRQIDKTKENYGWFCESAVILPQVANNVANNLSHYKRKYKFIFTHNRTLIQIDPEFIKFTLPHAMPWIQHRRIYDKTKLVSFIGSRKVMCSGHAFRQKKIIELRGQVDHFGRGYPGKELPMKINTANGIESGKILGLKDYIYSA